MQVTVFQEFFIEMQLPYSMLLNESLNLSVTVYYFVKGDGQQQSASVAPVNVSVQLARSADDSFVARGNDKHSMDDYYVRDLSDNVLVAPKQPKSVYFAIRPKRLGHITLKASASVVGHSSISDSVEQSFLVEVCNSTVI